jgi:hypothetical protein
MAEESKEPKKTNILTLQINLDELMKPEVLPPCPENQQIWEKDSDMGQDCAKMISISRLLATYLARCCNEGPEVKDNVVKRMVLAKIILETFMSNLNVNGYFAYGILTELLHDIYMSISGKHQTISLLKKISNRMTHLAQDKSRSYTS